MHKLCHNRCRSQFFGLDCFHWQHSGIAGVLRVLNMWNRIFHSLDIGSEVALKIFLICPICGVFGCLRWNLIFPLVLILSSWMLNLQGLMV